MSNLKNKNLLNRIIFCLWTGQELLSNNRIKALWSIFKNTGRPVAFVTAETINEWVLPQFPLHPAYEYLSSTHKSDYLRCYLMHHYGGGYTDIKYTTVRWESFFSQLENNVNALALGYEELPHGIPHLHGEIGDTIRASHSELIGLCAFIFKPYSELTQAWYDQLHILLDTKLESLKLHPAQHPLDQNNVILPNNEKSLYPLRWAEILGEILHPLFYDYKSNLIKQNIAPIFSNYR